MSAQVLIPVSLPIDAATSLPPVHETDHGLAGDVAQCGTCGTLRAARFHAV